MFHSYVTVNYQGGPRKTGQILMKRKISRVQCPQLGEGFAHVWTYPLLSISWQRKILEHPRTIFVYCIYCIVDFLTQKGNVVLLHFKHAHRTSQYEHKIPSVWKCALLHNFCLLAELARVSQNFARFKLGWDGWQKNMNTFWKLRSVALNRAGLCKLARVVLFVLHLWLRNSGNRRFLHVWLNCACLSNCVRFVDTYRYSIACFVQFSAGKAEWWPERSINFAWKHVEAGVHPASTIEISRNGEISESMSLVLGRKW